MKKVYISGKVTGCKNWRSNFMFSENRIEKKFKNQAIEIINPLRIAREVETLISNPDYKDYLKRDIEYLLDADVVYMQKNWLFSKGAKLEHHIARAMGKNIIYELL